MKRLFFHAAALAAGLLAASAAQAKDTDPCPAGLVCASDPSSIEAALRDAGYLAAVEKDDVGDPMIETVGADRKFTIFFYDCENGKSCAALQFRITFAKDERHTPDLANKWNARQRFIRFSVLKDQRLELNYDLSTIGGLTKKNFADVVDWWKVMCRTADKFFSENLGPK